MAKINTVILFFTLLLPLATLPTGEPDNPEVGLALSCKTLDLVEVNFLLGERDEIKQTFEGKHLWEEAWRSYTPTTDTPTTDIGLFIKQEISQSVDEFLYKMLGVEDAEVKRVEVKVYKKDKGVNAFLTLKFTEKEKTLHLLKALAGKETNVNVKVDTGGSVGVDCFTFLHYRTPWGEHVESSKPLAITLVEKPFCSPIGMFSVLLTLIGGCVALSLYSRKYVRGTRLSGEFWVIAVIFYVLAMIPYNLYIFYILLLSGVLASAYRSGKGMRIGKLELNRRIGKQAKKKTVGEGRKGINVEKLLRKNEK